MIKEGVAPLASVSPATFMNVAIGTVTVVFAAVLLLLFLAARRKPAPAVEVVRNINKEQRGITGLETAIVLISFVMVATVFAYVVLSSGLYSSQKAKEAVNSGLSQTRSTLQLKGDVVAKMDAGVATEIVFSVGIVPGGEAIDMTDTSAGKNKVVISYSDQYQQYPALDWTVTKVVQASGSSDFMMDTGDTFQVVVDLKKVNDGASDPSHKVGAYTKFVVEIKPPVGAVVTIERTMPARSSDLVQLY